MFIEPSWLYIFYIYYHFFHAHLLDKDYYQPILQVKRNKFLKIQFQQFLDFLGFFFLGFFFFPLYIPVFDGFIHIASSLMILFSVMFSLLVSPSETFFIYFVVFLHVAFLFDSFLEFLTLPICYCILYTLFIRDLSILIMDVLNYWCNNFHISVISESGFDV